MFLARRACVVVLLGDSDLLAPLRDLLAHLRILDLAAQRAELEPTTHARDAADRRLLSDVRVLAKVDIAQHHARHVLEAEMHLVVIQVPPRLIAFFLNLHEHLARIEPWRSIIRVVSDARFPVLARSEDFAQPQHPLFLARVAPVISLTARWTAIVMIPLIDALGVIAAPAKTPPLKRIWAADVDLVDVDLVALGIKRRLRR